jgi:hypothetical protein
MDDERGRGTGERTDLAEAFPAQVPGVQARLRRAHRGDAGPTGSGKTSLAAWFVANGFRYLSDEVVAYHRAGRGPDDVGSTAARERLHFSGSVALDDHRARKPDHVGSAPDQRPMPERIAGRSPQPCGLIIFPKFEPGAPLRQHDHPTVQAHRAGVEDDSARHVDDQRTHNLVLEQVEEVFSEQPGLKRCAAEVEREAATLLLGYRDDMA